MLAIGVQDGPQPGAFDDLVDAYERRIYNLIYRLMGDLDEAADLTRDTFAAAYRSFGRLRAEASPHTWLYRIAVNVCKNRFREPDRQRNVERVSLEDSEAGRAGLVDETGCGVPPAAPEREEVRRVVEDAIRSLPEDCRIIVVLRDLHGLSCRGIAEAADLPVDVVKTTLARARRMLGSKSERYMG